MAKKNLKSALKAHEAKKSQAARARLAEEAAKRKAASIRGGGSPRDKSTLGNGRRGLGSGSGAAVRRERGGRSQPDVDASSGASAVGKAKQVPRAFEKDDTILLVGEGEPGWASGLVTLASHCALRCSAKATRLTLHSRNRRKLLFCPRSVATTSLPPATLGARNGV